MTIQATPTRQQRSLFTPEEQLIRDHLPIVGYVVNEFALRLPGHVGRDDLTSAGMTGLVLAARGYDPDTGVPFQRYASMRIRGAVLDELRAQDWATRGARSRAREVAKAEERLTDQLSRTPTSREIADELGVDLAELDRRREESERAVLSLDAFDATLGDTLPDETPDPSDHLEHAEQVGYLRAALATLPERLRKVAVGVYLEQRPMAQLAEELGVTESRISQLRSEALDLLRGAMNAQFAPDRMDKPARPTGVAARRRAAYYAEVARQAAMIGMQTSPDVGMGAIRSA